MGFFDPLPEQDGSLDGMLQWLSRQTISFEKIVSGALASGQNVESSNFVTGTSGWQFAGAGSVETNAATINSPTIATPTFTGQSLFAVGSAAAPSISFSGDPDTGIYRYSANQIGLVAGGTHGIRITNTYIRTIEASEGSATIKHDATGTAAAPVYTFNGDVNLGMYRVGADQLGFSAGGNRRMTVHTTAVLVGANVTGNPRMRADLAGTALVPAYSFVGDTDTGMYRLAANVLGFSVGGVIKVTVNAARTIMDNMLNLGGQNELTVAAGAITVTQSYHQVDTESNASTDNLDTINGGSEGDILVLRSATGARDTTLRDGVGNIQLAGSVNFTLAGSNYTIMLLFGENTWLEISRSAN